MNKPSGLLVGNAGHYVPRTTPRHLNYGRIGMEGLKSLYEVP